MRRISQLRKVGICSSSICFGCHLEIDLPNHEAPPHPHCALDVPLESPSTSRGAPRWFCNV